MYLNIQIDLLIYRLIYIEFQFHYIIISNVHSSSNFFFISSIFCIGSTKIYM
ncbi:uncharacterized protein DS421_1g17320 [Arachis hypogaea]|nr:uncharacterized protein DS421_1g17320 [Arachis hypogaea]